MDGSKAEKEESRFINKTSIIQRPGWSRSLVEKILGEPDEKKKSFHYGTQVSLYLISRVLEAESKENFQTAQSLLQKRKAAAQKGTSTKIASLLEAIEVMPISVKEVKNVRQCAIKSYNNHALNRGSESYASALDDQEFLDRITVNFIRHELTQYDQAILDAAGKAGVQKAIFRIRQRVYAAIAQAYPALSDQCQAQLQSRSM